MSVDDNKTLYRKYRELLREVDRLDDLVAADFVGHYTQPGQPPGRDGLKTQQTLLAESFPDLQTEILDVIAEGDRVVGRVKIVGTHTGKLRGLEPTSRRISSELIEIVRIADGKIVERWGVRDRLLEMQQLGLWSPRKP